MHVKVLTILLSLTWLASAGWADDAPPEKGLHWAYRPLRRPAVPVVKDVRWTHNAIDRFVMAELERQGLRPAPPVSAQTLLRRMSFDLTGLPPSPADFDRAAELTSTGNSFAEGLLGSSAYAEHWARHWMDVARYADSAGYELDTLFSHAWHYRDWLIHSLQANKPMDRFIEEQIAGDELWPESSDARDGVLFLTIGPKRHEGGIQRAAERDYEWLTDMTDTAGSVFLGTTLGCTRCHDHKFDPFTQRDYFGLQAIFADGQLDPRANGKTSAGYDKNIGFFIIPRAKPLDVKILRRGELDSPTVDAPPALPAKLAGGGPIGNTVAASARRATLARWLTSPDNPLTARVLVNRIWQWHFGKALVRTPNDFGTQGDRPTHPELLDWLACELIESGWDLRHLHLLILQSATYRMSCDGDSQARAKDPELRLLSRFPRRRLTAEELRDSMLSACGELNPKSFGPPVIPPVEAWELSGISNKNWEVTPDPAEHRRRSIYLIVRRSVTTAFPKAFNVPDTANSCPARDSTVVPNQALALWNSKESLARAAALAGRLWRESGGDAGKAAQLAWRLLFGRNITDSERDAAIAFLAQRESAWAGSAPAPEALPAGVANHAPPPARGAAWVEWCLALFNANEFLYVD